MRVITTAAAAISLLAVHDAHAICREVYEAGTPPPVMQPAEAVLIAKRSGVVVGESCPSTTPDAGVPLPDAGVADAGPPPDAATTPDAGCTPVLGDVVSMIVQPRFTIGADGARFALLMVTPKPPVIAVEDHELFAKLAQLTAPEVVVKQVEVEDVSLGYQCKDPKWNSSGGCSGVGGSTGGGGYNDPYRDASFGSNDDGGVAIQTVGAYEVIRVTSTDRASLAGWLTQFGYVYTSYDLDAVEPYMAAGWTVIAVRVAVDHAHDGGLEPLSFTWPGKDVRLPLGIGQRPSPVHYPLTVYVSAEGRYELGGGHVSYARWTASPAGVGTSFLTRVELDVDPAKAAANDPVAAHVPDEQYSDTVTVTQEVHIPSSECPESSSKSDMGCCDSGAGPESSFGFLIAAIAICVTRRRAPRRR